MLGRTSPCRTSKSDGCGYSGLRFDDVIAKGAKKLPLNVYMGLGVA